MYSPVPKLNASRCVVLDQIKGAVPVPNACPSQSMLSSRLRRDVVIARVILSLAPGMGGGLKFEVGYLTIPLSDQVLNFLEFG